MKNCKLPLVFLLFVFVFTACKNDAKKEVVEDSLESEEVADTIPDNTWTDDSDNEYQPGDDELREFGIIEVIEDGGYPFFVVTVNFVERNMKQDFNLNIEAIGLDMEDLTTLTDKWATIYYTSELENRLMDMHFNGESVSGEYAPEKIDPSWKKITGILRGAEAATPGDLPDTITVTNAKGETIEFGLFIDAETVKANGKEVTAYYYIQGVNTITHIQPSEE